LDELAARDSRGSGNTLVMIHDPGCFVIVSQSFRVKWFDRSARLLPALGVVALPLGRTLFLPVALALNFPALNR